MLGHRKRRLLGMGLIAGSLVLTTCLVRPVRRKTLPSKKSQTSRLGGSGRAVGATSRKGRSR